MTVLGLTKCDLIVEVSLIHGLLVSGKYLLNEILGQVSYRLPFQALFSLSVFLCFLLEVLGMVNFAPLSCSLIHEGYTTNTQRLVVFLG